MDEIAGQLKALFERCYNAAVNVARRHCYNGTTAEDAAQEAFIIAFEKLKLKPDGEIKIGFVLNAARLRALHLLRTDSNHHKYESRSAKERPEAAVERSDATVEADEQAARLKARLEVLSVVERELIDEHVFLELSFGQIAARHGMEHRSTALRRYERALKKLCRALEEADDETS